MTAKLYESELKVMDVLWEHGQMKAKDIAVILKERTGWNVNTTYTIIKRCMKKDAIKRKEPAFQCIPLVTREEVQKDATNELVDRMFDGSADKLFASLVGSKSLSGEEIQRLKDLVEDLE